MTHKRQSLKHVQQWTRAAGGRYIETTALSVRHQHIRGRRRGAREGACIGAATTPEVDPQCRCFGRRESDFALQRLEECRALGPERVRLVALHASGSEEGLAVAAKWASSPGGEWGAKMFVALHNVTNIFFEEARQQRSQTIRSGAIDLELSNL